MFATTSYDGFICVYILPNKLITMIKHPENLYYNKVFLSSNPFPSIIAFNEKKNILNSYTLSGILINSIKIEGENESVFKIIPLFDSNGGSFKDKLKFECEGGNYIIVNVPLLYK